MWLFVFVCKWVFICMCLLTPGIEPGPAHLLTSPNWWHHRNSMTRLFLIAAAIAAVTVAIGRPHSSPLAYTFKPFAGQIAEPVFWPSQLLDIMDVKMLIVTTVVMVVEGFKSIWMKWCVKSTLKCCTAADFSRSGAYPSVSLDYCAGNKVIPRQHSHFGAALQFSLGEPATSDPNMKTPFL